MSRPAGGRAHSRHRKRQSAYRRWVLLALGVLMMVVPPLAATGLGQLSFRMVLPLTAATLFFGVAGMLTFIVGAIGHGP